MKVMGSNELIKYMNSMQRTNTFCPVSGCNAVTVLAFYVDFLCFESSSTLSYDLSVCLLTDVSQHESFLNRTITRGSLE